jgi:hypothetical protein
VFELVGPRTQLLLSFFSFRKTNFLTNKFQAFFIKLFLLYLGGIKNNKKFSKNR